MNVYDHMGCLHIWWCKPFHSGSLPGTAFHPFIPSDMKRMSFWTTTQEGLGKSQTQTDVIVYVVYVQSGQHWSALNPDFGWQFLNGNAVQLQALQDFDDGKREPVCVKTMRSRSTIHFAYA